MCAWTKGRRSSNAWCRARPLACAGWAAHAAASLQAGRFLANPKVTVEKIIAGWSDRTIAAVAGRHVLAIQDTTEVRVPATAQRRRGLGPIGHGNIYGVPVHAMLAVDAASGACLGLVGGQVWTRSGVVATAHRERPAAERESAPG